jgi:hypothetical protein
MLLLLFSGSEPLLSIGRRLDRVTMRWWYKDFASVKNRTAVFRIAGALWVYFVSTEGKLLLSLQCVVVFGTKLSACQGNLLPSFSEWCTLGMEVSGFSETL